MGHKVPQRTQSRTVTHTQRPPARSTAILIANPAKSRTTTHPTHTDVITLNHICDHLRRRGVKDIPPAVASITRSGEYHFGLLPTTDKPADALAFLLNLIAKHHSSPCFFEMFSKAAVDAAMGLNEVEGHKCLMVLDLMFGQGQISLVDNVITPFLTRLRGLVNVVLTRSDMASFLRIPDTDLAQVKIIDVASTDLFFPNPYSSIRVMRKKHYVEIWASWAPTDPGACLRVFSFGRHLLDQNLQLSHLTKIHLVNYTIDWHHIFVHLILPCAPKLVDATLNIRFPKCIHPKFLPKFKKAANLVNLESLLLILVDTSQNPSFLNYLCVPKLKRVSVHAFDSYKPLHWDISSYIDCLAPSAISLHSLQFCDINPPGKVVIGGALKGYWGLHPELERLLTTFPRLRDLKLPLQVPLHVDTLWRLGTGEYLPDLQRIIATCTDVLSVCSMVARRSAIMSGSSRNGPLREVTLQAPKPPTNASIAEMGAAMNQVLQDCGIKVAVSFLPDGNLSHSEWEAGVYTWAKK